MGYGVWCSVVLRPPFMPAEASKCTLLAAVAVIKAINKYKGVNAKIKWPNDVLLEGKKMVGILTEMSAEFGKINYIVIGTGINTNVPRSMIPDELKDLAISVADVAQEPIQRVQILADYQQTFLVNIHCLPVISLVRGNDFNRLPDGVRISAPFIQHWPETIL